MLGKLEQFIKGNEERISQLSEVMFFCGYLLWLVWKFWCTTVLSFPSESPIHSISHRISLVLLLFPFVYALKNKKALPWIISGLAVGVGVKFCTGEILLCDLVLILSASTTVPFKKTAKVTLCVTSILTVAVVTLSLFGVIVDYPFARGNEVRHGLGFLYCAFSSHLLLYISILYFYLKDKNAPWASYLVFACVNIALYVLTDTKSSFALLFLVCIISIARKCKGMSSSFSKKLSSIVKFLPIVILAVSLICSICYDSSSDVWKNVNKATSYRISQTHKSLLEYGIEPFGQKIDFVGQTLEMGSTTELAKEITSDADRNYIDNSFVSVLVRQGWLAEVWLLVFLYFAGRNAHLKKEYLACGFLIVIYLHAAFDPRLLNLVYNSFLFFMWKMAIETDVRVPFLKPPVEVRAKHARRPL